MALSPPASVRFTLALLLLQLASACKDDPPPTQPPPEDTSPPITSAAPPGGTFTTPFSVTLSCDDGDGSGCAATHYTADGTTPSSASARYQEPIPVSATTTLKFFSVDEAGNLEDVKTQQYIFSAASHTVTANPRGGTYGSVQSVTLTCSAS